MKIWYRCHFITHLDFWVWDFLRFIICIPKNWKRKFTYKEASFKVWLSPLTYKSQFPKEKEALSALTNILWKHHQFWVAGFHRHLPTHSLFFFFPLSLYILILTAVWITDLIICGQSNRIGFIFRKEYKMGQIELLWYLGLGAIWGLTTSISWDTLQSDHGGATQIDKKKLQFVIQWKDQRHSEMFYTVIQ